MSIRLSFGFIKKSNTEMKSERTSSEISNAHDA